MRLIEWYRAFRKAKQEALRDTLSSQAEEFAAYEVHLARNLSRLNRLFEAGDDWAEDAQFWGLPTYSLKAARYPKKSGVIVSSPPPNATLDEPSFRPILRPSVDAHVLSALWVAHVGEKLDGCLAKTSVGNRLRRLRGKRRALGPYHVQGSGIFRYYESQYRRWRDGALRVAQRELDANRTAVLLTLDITRFYERVDTRIFGTRSSLNRLTGNDHLRLSASDLRLHRTLLAGIRAISHALDATHEPLGLPIGLSASHVLANVALAPIDRRVTAKLKPLYYSRYVDDFLFVLSARKTDDAQEVVEKALSAIAEKIDGAWEFATAPKRRSRYVVENSKRRVFFLSPGSGQDVLSAIRGATAEISSERNLVPNLEEPITATAKRMIALTDADGLETGALKVGDTLAFRRLALAVTLSRYETTGRLVDPGSWRSERRKFYQTLWYHFFRADQLDEYSHYLRRIITFAVAMRDFDAAGRMVALYLTSLATLRRSSSVSKQAALYLRNERLSVRDAILKGISPIWPPGDHVKAGQLIGRLERRQSSSKQAKRIAASISAADLSWTALKAHVLELNTSGLSWLPRCRVPTAFSSSDIDQARVTGIQRFLKEAGLPSELTGRLLFPTRPFSPIEISHLVPSTAKNPRLWAEFVGALRGSWVGSNDPATSYDHSKILSVPDGTQRSQTPLQIAVASFETPESCFARAAVGRPDESLARFMRFARTLNDTLRIGGRPPRYLVMPELSTPRRWALAFAEFLGRRRTSLIAGLEYRVGNSNEVINEAAICLVDTRLGFPGISLHRQVKRAPAVQEAEELLKEGRRMSVRDEPRLIWKHGDHFFGVLICSELSNAELIAHYRGHVDSLFVLSWNKDLETFSALVDAAAYEDHCFIVLANNRLYGDSRIRAPYKESHRRDLLRVRGGYDDYVVAANLPVFELRRAHSRRDIGGVMKPLPDGFVAIPARA